jgi:tetrahydromethanopterin S-methyltransferase subunit G
MKVNLLKKIFLVSILSLCVLVQPLLAGNAKNEARAAWEALNAEKERLNDIMYEIENGANQIQPGNYEAFIERLEKFEKKDSAVMREKIETLGKTCGTDIDKLEGSMKKLLGKNPDGWDWSMNVVYFDKIIKAIPKLRKDLGEAISTYASMDLNGMKDYSEEIRAKKFVALKKRINLGLRYDPHSKALIDLSAKAEEAANKDAAVIAKLIAGRKWPGNNKAFKGPGSPAELNKAALEYFKSTCRPVEKAHLACVTDSDWYCFKRNIFGQPIQWALTFKVAVDVEGETNDDVIYAWSISFLTAEKVGVKKAPPFKMAAFNGKKKMKRANVPGLK